MTGYFTKFPVISYANNRVLNITARSKIPPALAKNKFAFYPYTVKDNQRADSIASFYYKDPYYVWMIYYANDIIDPYYGWYVGDEVFNNFIVKKYGSIREAQRKIHHFASNWYDDNREINSVTFNALADNHKKYWQEKIALNNRVISYSRREEILDVSTNKVVRFVANSTIGSVGDVVNITLGANTICTMQISYQDGEQLLAKCVVGDYRRLIRVTPSASNNTLIIGESCDFKSGANVVTAESVPVVIDNTNNAVFFYEGTIPSFTSIVGQTSGATINVASYAQTTITTDSNTTLTYTESEEVTSTALDNTVKSVGIPDDELVYWSAVSCYEHEYNLNSTKRNIRLFDNAQALQLDKALERSMKV